MEALKVCKSCGMEKQRTEFHNTGWHTRKDGTRTELVKPSCKACANTSHKQWREDVLNSVVVEWKCVVCGYDKCQAALDFHHRDSALKDFTIAARVSVSAEALKREIEKCILVCANCHREIHAGLHPQILGD